MKKTQEQTVGTRMRQVREVMHLSQEKLAKRLFVSRSCISNYETSRRNPNLEILARFADELNVNLDYIIGSEESKGRNVKLQEYDTEIAKYLTEDGHLDLSQESPIVRIAIVEYYLHLKGKYYL